MQNLSQVAGNGLMAMPLGVDQSFSVEIGSAVIGGDTIETVNAKELHEKLKNGKRYQDWIKQRIEQFDFTQGIDFTVIRTKVSDGTAFVGLSG